MFCILFYILLYILLLEFPENLWQKFCQRIITLGPVIHSEADRFKSTLAFALVRTSNLEGSFLKADRKASRRLVEGELSIGDCRK